MERPALFETGMALAPADDREAALPWPGGTVAWACGDPPSALADGAWRDADRRLFAWALPGARVELALWPVAPELPPGMAVTAAWVGHWRIRLDADGPPPVLRCGPRGDPHDAGGEPGEWLVAHSWEHEAGHLTVGTEDEEALAERAGTTLPGAWEAGLRALWRRDGPSDEPWPARSGPAGVDLVLPAAPAGTTIDVHHAAAWRDVVRLPDDLATWFAVDEARRALPPPARWA